MSNPVDVLAPVAAEQTAEQPKSELELEMTRLGLKLEQPKAKSELEAAAAAKLAAAADKTKAAPITPPLDAAATAAPAQKVDDAAVTTAPASATEVAAAAPEAPKQAAAAAPPPPKEGKHPQWAAKAVKQQLADKKAEKVAIEILKILKNQDKVSGGLTFALAAPVVKPKPTSPKSVNDADQEKPAPAEASAQSGTRIIEAKDAEGKVVATLTVTANNKGKVGNYSIAVPDMTDGKVKPEDAGKAAAKLAKAAGWKKVIICLENLQGTPEQKRKFVEEFQKEHGAENVKVVATKQELQEYHNHPATHSAKGEKGITRAQAFNELSGTFDDAMKKAKTAETTKSAAPAPAPTK